MKTFLRQSLAFAYVLSTMAIALSVMAYSVYLMMERSAPTILGYLLYFIMFIVMVTYSRGIDWATDIMFEEIKN
jgi:hypothetical protein